MIGTTWPVFIGLTVILLGGAGWMTGQALARSWRPLWQTVPYCLLLGLVDRFLTWGLFQGALLTLPGYLIGTAVILALGLIAYRATQTRKMVDQYPWLYQRTGPFTWREKA